LLAHSALGFGEGSEPLTIEGNGATVNQTTAGSRVLEDAAVAPTP
jgi:hypothetical protein